MTKLKERLEKEKIDPRRLLVASRTLEALSPQDRAIRLAQRQVRGGKPTDAEKALAEQKAKSGKPITRPLLDRALRGERLSRGARARIVRAVNHVLKAKKKAEVAGPDLF